MKKKVLLLGDNIQKFTGVGHIGNQIVTHSLDKFDWVQLAGASSTNIGDRLDISKEYQEKTGLKDASVIQYPATDYGNPGYLRHVIEQEQPDIILHITDPRYWLWMYDMEYELHTSYNLPIVYYAIWDNYPAPLWNYPYYESSDHIISISKLSEKVHAEVLTHADKEVRQSYVPHGIDEDIFTRIDEDHDDYNELQRIRSEFKSRHGADKIFFWNNVNMKRKRPQDVIKAYKIFTDRNPEYKTNSCLVMHTSLVSPAGTDLLVVKRHLFDDCNVIFSTEKVSSQILNYYYNLSCATINIAYNEGFGLSNLEALMAGCPTITNQTGGLQDQSYNSLTYKLEPEFKVLGGTPATPYIYQDYCDLEHVANGMEWAYKLDDDDRLSAARSTREKLIAGGFTAREMSNKIADILQDEITNWVQPKTYQIINVHG